MASVVYIKRTANGRRLRHREIAHVKTKKNKRAGRVLTKHFNGHERRTFVVLINRESAPVRKAIESIEQNEEGGKLE